MVLPGVGDGELWEPPGELWEPPGEHCRLNQQDYPDARTIPLFFFLAMFKDIGACHCEHSREALQ